MDSWNCNNSNADSTLYKLKTSNIPSCTYWIEKNLVYYNKACIELDTEDLELREHTMTYSFNPFFSIHIRDTYLKSYDYAKTHITPFIQPGVILIE